MSNLQAYVFGATGLTGKFVTEHLLSDERYSGITIFVRQETKLFHGKIEQVIYNPENPEILRNNLGAGHVFCCIGTTIKKAGSRDAFRAVDHLLVTSIGKLAKEAGARAFSVISTVGANDKSGNFYLRTKGQMEKELQTIGFENLVILRPSMLLGMRSENRLMEDIGKAVFRFVEFAMVGKLRKYRAIHSETVARAMIQACNIGEGIHILESDKIYVIALRPNNKKP